MAVNLPANIVNNPLFKILPQCKKGMSKYDYLTAIKAMESFPEFSKHALDMVGALREFSNGILEKNADSTKDAVAAYNKVLDNLDWQIREGGNLSPEQKFKIAEKMEEIADKISEKDTENKTFFGNVVGTLAKYAGGALAIAGTVVGAKIFIDNK